MANDNGFTTDFVSVIGTLYYCTKNNFVKPETSTNSYN